MVLPLGETVASARTPGCSSAVVDPARRSERRKDRSRQAPSDRLRPALAWEGNWALSDG